MAYAPTRAKQQPANMAVQLAVELRPSDCLGELTEHERKYAPEVLYASGDTSLLAQGTRVSVVGSRNASPDGCRRAASFVQKLVEKKITVVSGLALGIDYVAHTVAIKLGGSTIAVIGTPLDQVYPKQHADLQSLLMTNHLVVTQFSPGCPITPKNFVMRNRTMALLSDATVIVEAGERSGTEHQGWEALRLGRYVYIFESVVKNNITWAKKMVEYGAQILTRDSVDSMLDGIPTFTSQIQGAREAFAV